MTTLDAFQVRMAVELAGAEAARKEMMRQLVAQGITNVFFNSCSLDVHITTTVTDINGELVEWVNSE